MSKKARSLPVQLSEEDIGLLVEMIESWKQYKARCELDDALTDAGLMDEGERWWRGEEVEKGKDDG